MAEVPANLRFMAVVEEAGSGKVYDHHVDGSKKCRAPGCPNWFVPAGNRQRYCKADNCTYKRGKPVAAEVEMPSGAAAEVLLRLQEEDSGEVGPQMLVTRRRAVAEALQAGDLEAVGGALIDEATACIWFADRALSGNLPLTKIGATGPPPFAGMAQGSSGTQRPIGLVHAVLSAHRRTFNLAERRHDSLWDLLSAREAVADAQMGVRVTAGGPKEAEAQQNLAEKQVALARAEGVHTSIEAAWLERREQMTELSAAAASLAPAGASGPRGGNGGSPRAIAA